MLNSALTMVQKIISNHDCATRLSPRPEQLAESIKLIQIAIAYDELSTIHPDMINAYRHLKLCGKVAL